MDSHFPRYYERMNYLFILTKQGISKLDTQAQGRLRVPQKEKKTYEFAE